MRLSARFNQAALWGREILAFALPTGMAWRGPSKLEPNALPDVPARPVTKAELQATQPFYNNGKNALIWAYIGGDTPTRGDTHGTIGIARRVAEILGGRALVVDCKMLDGHFENLPRATQLLNLAAAEGYPDLILGTQSERIEPCVKSKATLRLTQFNEDLSGKFFSHSSDLVAHHLTPAMLAAEGEKFDLHYPQAQTGTLMGVLCANIYKGKTEWAYKIANVMAHEERGTIFVCPCHRTSEESRADFVSHIKNRLSAIGAADRIHVESLPFVEIERGAYNPYRGLLARADHLLVAGTSQSMVSEALFAGKRVYLARTHLDISEYIVPRLRGHLKDFNRCSEKRPLHSPTHTPYDATGDTAARVVRAFDRLARLRALANKEVPSL